MKKAVGWILIGIVAIVAIWAVSLPFVIGNLDKDIAARARAQRVLPISLGLGGTGCRPASHPAVFTTADPIRLISDEAPGSEDVVIELVPLHPDTTHPAPAGYPAHRHFDSTAQCVSENLPPLSPGGYEAWVHVGESRASIDFLVVAP